MQFILRNVDSPGVYAGNDNFIVRYRLVSAASIEIEVRDYRRGEIISTLIRRMLKLSFNFSDRPIESECSNFAPDRRRTILRDYRKRDHLSSKERLPQLPSSSRELVLLD